MMGLDITSVLAHDKSVTLWRAAERRRLLQTARGLDPRPGTAALVRHPSRGRGPFAATSAWGGCGGDAERRAA
jgi:hypothetical protein